MKQQLHAALIALSLSAVASAQTDTGAAISGDGQFSPRRKASNSAIRSGEETLSHTPTIRNQPR